jgi:hypothetical protein
VDVSDPSGFARALSHAPSWAKIYNRLGAKDPIHFSVSGYETGGVVPGARGAPQLAVVHGGETILPTHKLSHHIDSIASYAVRWGDKMKRFFLETNAGDVGIPTKRMQRDFFNQFVGRGISRAQMVAVIPWWEREGYFEQLASRKRMKRFDRGGWLMPGLTLAQNNTGKPERVGGSGEVHFHFPNYVGSKQELISMMKDAAAQFQRRNNRPAFG